MKRVFFAFLIVLLAGSACLGLLRTVRGSGDIQTKSFDVSGFDQVQLETIGEVYIEQGDSESLTIETDDNILPMLRVRVKNGKLTLSSRNNTNLTPSNTITYRITVKRLTAVTTDSSGDFFAGPLEGERLGVFIHASGNVSLDEVQVEEFSIRSDGSGDVEVKAVHTDDLQVRISASGDVDMAGSTASLLVEGDGSGILRARNLEAATAEVNLQASGDATVWAVDKLDVTLDGSGSLSYYGSPRMTTNLDGSGDLQSLGEK